MRVRFTANRDFALTRNNVYDVLGQTRDRYSVRNDNDTVQSYAKNLFEVVPDEAITDAINNQNIEQPVRRRGRPSNAEIAARHQQLETDAQRHAREAQAAQNERVRQEQIRAAARQSAEQQRLRTDADRIASIDDNFIRNADNAHNGQIIEGRITFDDKRTVGDTSRVKTINYGMSLRGNTAFSCGIKMLSGIENFLGNILNNVDYANDDHTELTAYILKKVLQENIDTVLSNINNRPGMVIMSVTTRNPRHLQLILENTDFVEVSRANNGNSGNTIVLLTRILRQA